MDLSRFMYMRQAAVNRRSLSSSDTMQAAPPRPLNRRPIFGYIDGASVPTYARRSSLPSSYHPGSAKVRARRVARVVNVLPRLSCRLNTRATTGRKVGCTGVSPRLSFVQEDLLCIKTAFLL